MADERTAYPESSRRSEQLSCRKYFDPSYGLFYINFKVFKIILKIIIIKLIQKLVLLHQKDVSMTSVVNRAVDWSIRHVGPTAHRLRFN